MRHARLQGLGDGSIAKLTDDVILIMSTKEFKQLIEAVDVANGGQHSIALAKALRRNKYKALASALAEVEAF